MYVCAAVCTEPFPLATLSDNGSRGHVWACCSLSFRNYYLVVIPSLVNPPHRLTHGIRGSYTTFSPAYLEHSHNGLLPTLLSVIHPSTTLLERHCVYLYLHRSLHAPPSEHRLSRPHMNQPHFSTLRKKADDEYGGSEPRKTKYALEERYKVITPPESTASSYISLSK